MDKKQALLSTLKTKGTFEFIFIAILGILVGLPVIYFSGSWFVEYGSNIMQKNPAEIIFFGLLFVLSAAFFITLPVLIQKNNQRMKQLVEKYLFAVESLKLDLEPTQLWYEQDAPFTVTRHVIPLAMGLSKIKQNEKELKIFHAYDNDHQFRLINGGCSSNDNSTDMTCFEIPTESQNRFMIFPKKAMVHSIYGTSDEKRMTELTENFMIIFYFRNMADNTEEIELKKVTEAVKSHLGEKFLKDLNELPGLNSILFAPTYIRLHHQGFVVETDELKKYIKFISDISVIKIQLS
jgi:hypothetical protein